IARILRIIIRIIFRRRNSAPSGNGHREQRDVPHDAPAAGTGQGRVENHHVGIGRADELNVIEGNTDDIQRSAAGILLEDRIRQGVADGGERGRVTDYVLEEPIPTLLVGAINRLRMTRRLVLIKWKELKHPRKVARLPISLVDLVAENRENRACCEGGTSNDIEPLAGPVEG